jgi:exosome complex component CSL4
MSEIRKKNGQFLIPGDRLGVIEEFISGPGTYVEDGIIYSKTIGRLLLDFLNKQVSVYPLSQLINLPKIKSIVSGAVSSVQSKRAIMDISQVGKRLLSKPFTGVLHISDVTTNYVEMMSDACKPGDILRAKIISDKNQTYHLATIDRDLGVICAFCSSCGEILAKKNRKMQCIRCGNIEKRKISSDYGKAEI